MFVSHYDDNIIIPVLRTDTDISNITVSILKNRYLKLFGNRID